MVAALAARTFLGQAVAVAPAKASSSRARVAPVRASLYPVRLPLSVVSCRTTCLLYHFDCCVGALYKENGRNEQHSRLMLRSGEWKERVVIRTATASLRPLALDRWRVFYRY